jgi:hypothetical protein
LELPGELIAQAERVRAACLERARSAGVTDERAELIADAVYGQLVRAGSGATP